MAKSCLGIDIGKDQMKLVLMKGENIVKTASVQMPEKFIQLISETLPSGIPCKFRKILLYNRKSDHP